MDHVNDENGPGARKSRDQAAHDLGMGTISNDRPNSARPGQTPQRVDGPDEPQRLTEAGARDLHHLCPEQAQPFREVAAAKPQGRNQTSTTKLWARLEQIEEDPLGATDLGGRLDEQEVALWRVVDAAGPRRLERLVHEGSSL